MLVHLNMINNMASKSVYSYIILGLFVAVAYFGLFGTIAYFKPVCSLL